MLECAAEHELLLHQLPADALAAVFQRLHADDLERLSFVPSHAIASFVQADSVWNPVMCSVFGNALAAAVARSSCDGVQASETVNRGIPDLIPIWLSEAMPHSSVEQKAWIQCCDEWKRRPTLRTGYRILMRLIPASLLSSSSFAGWVVKLTSDETTQEAKASVISEFIHLNARIWASNRDNGGECPCAIVAGALTEYLTTPLADPSAELAKAACRAYVCTFQLRGLDLVPALRVFLHQTRMPKEGRRMCRLLWGFAGHFFAQNGGFTPETPRELIKGEVPSTHHHGKWVSHDTVYLMVMSLILLNADAHNPCVKIKMQEHQWLHNTNLSLHSVNVDVFSAPPSHEQAGGGGGGSGGGGFWGNPGTQLALNQESMSRMFRDVSRTPLLAVHDFRREHESKMLASTGGGAQHSFSAFLSFFRGFM